MRPSMMISARAGTSTATVSARIISTGAWRKAPAMSILSGPSGPALTTAAISSAGSTPSATAMSSGRPAASALARKVDKRRVGEQDAHARAALDHHAMDAHAAAAGRRIGAQHDAGGDEGAAVAGVVGQHRQQAAEVERRQVACTSFAGASSVRRGAMPWRVRCR
jgi:hypothetical protein